MPEPDATRPCGPSPDPASPEGFDQDQGKLFDQLARELRAIAGSMARRNDTLQPTALVNEAYLKLSRSDGKSWNDREHFLNSAAQTMLSILLDHKKAKAAQKRGGDCLHHPLDDTLAAVERDVGGRIEALHECLQILAEQDRDLAKLVNLKYFAGRSIAEICAVMGISERTGGRRWQFARAWLHDQMTR